MKLFQFRLPAKLIFFLLIVPAELMAYSSGFTDAAVTNTDSQENGLNIWVPRPHNPEFVEPGGVFSVELKGASDLSEEGWTAMVSNDLKTWPGTVETAKWDLIHHGTEDGWQLTISVPSDISPELMDLEIQHSSGITAVSRRSLHIVPDFEDDFYIFHQSDQHITADSAVVPGGKASARWGNGSKQALEWLTPVVNLTNPRFILHTGDNNQIYNSATDWAGFEEAKLRVQRFFEGVSNYTVPTVVVNGNHDIGWSSYDNFDLWRKQYTQQVGQRAFSFRMGSFYVLASEWTLTEYLDWAKSDYAASREDPSVEFRLFASHYYDGPDGWTTIATEEDACDLMLVGHLHRTRTLQTSPYKVLAVGTAQDYQRAAFFNFQRTDDGWMTPQAEQHADDINVHRLIGDWGAPTVSAAYDEPNDGTGSANLAVITNSLPHDFYNGRVRFLMTKGSYLVTGGEVLAQYDYDNGTKTAVLVQANIRKNAVTRISIDPE